jgi:hypothetical protein
MRQLIGGMLFVVGFIMIIGDPTFDGYGYTVNLLGVAVFIFSLYLIDENYLSKIKNWRRIGKHADNR